MSRRRRVRKHGYGSQVEVEPSPICLERGWSEADVIADPYNSSGASCCHSDGNLRNPPVADETLRRFSRSHFRSPLFAEMEDSALSASRRIGKENN
jgi:hypothetical protein